MGHIFHAMFQLIQVFILYDLNGIEDSFIVENDPGSLEDNYQFGQSTLQALNGARRRFNSPPLQINEQLSEIAQRWAEHMARNGKLEHSPADWRSYDRQTLGENYTASFQVELTGFKT